MSYPTSTASQYPDSRVLTLKRTLALLNSIYGVTVSTNYPYTSEGQYSDPEVLTLKRLNIVLENASPGGEFSNEDLSGLPTSNPGGGKPWLNGGVLQVGP